MTKMSVVTVFYADLEATCVTKKNHARYVRRAVLRAVDNMQMGRYDAALAEVYDVRDGKLHRIIVRSAVGEIKILYKSEEQ